ncbi:Glycosyl transferase family 2 [Marinobacter daqiaonensis]|uniref:Glycosyl transferase family 2 n=1 Tax=Marinobacter daqiaonensis TaxID=650891 RepID=A0A1I6H958_9GAMM|nr:glycosyltransferase family 2 protein [Marinobacter daqiaonensis]SFR50982.1 Glycosyl transferase family 2 [Marinobacter daqiaonensis]
MHTVEILLSTYNGEKYLSELLGSIIEQTYKDFIITIRDDGSRDSTVHIIDEFSRRYPGKVRVLDDAYGNLGSALSFSELLGRSSSPYIMFADQDDVWCPDKIDITLRKIKEMEAEYGRDTALLAFTDLLVVADDLSEISSSFWRFQRLDSLLSKNWRNILAQNVVTGCTVMINSQARDVCPPMPNLDMIYDHWLAINVAKNGHIDWLSTPTILYRQHSSNVEGAKPVDIFYMIGQLRHLKRRMVLYMKLSRIFDVSLFDIFIRKLVLNKQRLRRRDQ